MLILGRSCNFLPGMGLFTAARRGGYPRQLMRRGAEIQHGPWGKAIEYWLDVKKLRQADLAKLTDIQAKTISQLARGFHTQTRVLEVIAAALKVPFDQILVSPLQSGPKERRQEFAKGVIKDLLHSLEDADDLDAETAALAKRVQALKGHFRVEVEKLVSHLEDAQKKRHRKRAKRRTPPRTVPQNS